MTKQNTADATSPATDLRQRAARARDAAGRFMKRAAPIQAAPAAAAADEILEGWRAWHATLGKPEGDPEADAAYERATEHRYALLDAAEALPPTAENVVAKALAICWLEYVGEVSPKMERSKQSFTGRLALDIHEAIVGGAVARVPANHTIAQSPHPDAALFALGADFMAAWTAEAVDGDEVNYRACTRIAEQIVRTPAATAEGYGIKALLLARLDSDESGPHHPIKVHGPPHSWWNALHQVQVGAALLSRTRVTDALGSHSVIKGRLPVPNHDLSELSIVDLARLYPVIVLAEEVLSNAANAPCFSTNRSVFTPGGQIIDRESDRLSHFASIIAEEMSRRQPAVANEAEERVNTLLSHMVLTGGVAEHPELIAQINATWGA